MCNLHMNSCLVGFFFALRYVNYSMYFWYYIGYGNTGCGVFKRGVQN